jgi:hypothetical protein
MSMKKFIILILAVAASASFFATSAYANSSLNSPAAMPAITVTNHTTNPCSAGPINGCWKTSTTARPGDIISVNAYYENTGNETLHNVTLAIHPSRNGANVSFTGGVDASNSTGRVNGSASVSLSKTTTITLLLGSERPAWYPSPSGSAREVNSSALIGTGFNVGDVAPGGKGAIVARFRVDGEDTPTQSCSINSFTASPSTITSGNSSSLNWDTTGCDYVNITSVGNNLPSDGSRNVSPTTTTTYTLTAFPGGATRTVTVTVNNGGGNNDNCYINSFTASPSTITSGNGSTLNWDTTNCSYTTLSGYGQFGADDSKTVYPSTTTTYTLTAFPGGQTSTVTVNVNNGNNNSCSINSFYVDSNSITQGQTTVLHWTTSGANSVYLSGFGSQNPNGSISISPYSSTSYTLTLSGNNCSGNTTQSVYVTVNQSNVGNYAQPQAITTVGTPTSSYSAVLNGIAVPNTTGSTSAWFEYGSSTSLGNRSDSQVVNGNGQYPYNASISGLSAGRTYYFRAVVQNQAGTAYGSVVPFTTPSGSTYTPPTRVIVQSQTVSRANTGLIANSQPSLFRLQVDSSFDRMCVGGDIQYTVSYQNISSQQLDNSVLRITFPGELDYASSSQGDYSVVDRTLTIALGTVQPGEQGSVTVRAHVNNTALPGKLAVITATMVYTNPVSHAQEQAIAYSLITISNDCPSVLGASAFGFAGFLPQTLLQWLLLILVILALVVLARMLYRRKEEPAKTV